MSVVPYSMNRPIFALFKTGTLWINAERKAKQSILKTFMMGWLILAAAVSPGMAQQTTAAAPPALILQAISSLQGAAGPAPDVRLIGTVQYTAGSQNETGTFAFISRPDGSARTDITLPSGTHSQIRFPAGSTSSSISLDPNSTPQQIADHNLLVPANWYFPEHLLGSLGGSNRVVSRADPSKCSLSSVCFASQLRGLNPTSLAYFAEMSAMTMSLSSTTLQPTELIFTAHPNDKPNIGVLVKVLYSNYQTVGGHLVPFHMQQLVNGSLFLDITLSNADLNASIAPSDLTIR